jgi:hypothetical protein
MEEKKKGRKKQQSRQESEVKTTENIEKVEMPENAKLEQSANEIEEEKKEEKKQNNNYPGFFF